MGFDTYASTVSANKSSPSPSSSSSSSISRTPSRSSKLSSVSEKGAGGEDGGRDDCESLRLGVGRGTGDELGMGGDLGRFAPLGVCDYDIEIQ